MHDVWPYLHLSALRSRLKAAVGRAFRRPATLRLLPYDTAWPTRFADEAERLSGALGRHAVALEHVGSTAVPGLAGKPVLDIAVAVTSEREADACIAPLQALGYQYRGSHGEDHRRRYYVRDLNAVRTTQLHLYITPSTAWDGKLAFRDALRSDPELASAYQREKQRVAEAVDWDKAAYAVMKGPFVERVLLELGMRDG